MTADVPYAVALAVDALLVAALLAVAVAVRRVPGGAAGTALGCAVAGAVHTGLLALAAEPATYAVFGVLLVLFAASAARTEAAADPGGRRRARGAVRPGAGAAAGASLGLGAPRTAVLVLAVPAVAVGLGPACGCPPRWCRWRLGPAFCRGGGAAAWSVTDGPYLAAGAGALRRAGGGDRGAPERRPVPGWVAAVLFARRLGRGSAAARRDAPGGVHAAGLGARLRRRSPAPAHGPAGVVLDGVRPRAGRDAGAEPAGGLGRPALAAAAAAGRGGAGGDADRGGAPAPGPAAAGRRCAGAGRPARTGAARGPGLGRPAALGGPGARRTAAARGRRHLRAAAARRPPGAGAPRPDAEAAPRRGGGAGRRVGRPRGPPPVSRRVVGQGQQAGAVAVELVAVDVAGDAAHRAGRGVLPDRPGREAARDGRAGTRWSSGPPTAGSWRTCRSSRRCRSSTSSRWCRSRRRGRSAPCTCCRSRGSTSASPRWTGRSTAPGLSRCPARRAASGCPRDQAPPLLAK